MSGSDCLLWGGARLRSPGMCLPRSSGAVLGHWRRFRGPHTALTAPALWGFKEAGWLLRHRVLLAIQVESLEVKGQRVCRLTLQQGLEIQLRVYRGREVKSTNSKTSTSREAMSMGWWASGAPLTEWSKSGKSGASSRVALAVDW